jgi:tetratricopeptide (TPR) repeat protein
LNIRGDQGNPGIAPCIIKEVYFPPESPSIVATLIESALVYQNSANYEMAIDCFEKAKASWLEILHPTETPTLKKEQELFFELSIGSVYESCGKDDLALNQYMKAKEIKLPTNHPDLAFPYCGLGSVLYQMEEPAWALRLFLKAREIREATLGGDTVDTATVYNNLGCCMFMLERNEEAKAYFELANAILDCELGPQHERTLTSKRN